MTLNEAVCVPSLLQMLLAMANLARANYYCPDIPPTLGESLDHFFAYLRDIRYWAGNSTELADVLLLYTTAFTAGRRIDAMRCFNKPAQKLADPAVQRRVQRQLEELASGREQQGPLLTVQQLQYVCQHHISKHAAASAAAESPTGQLSESSTAVISSARAMLELEPDSPRSHFAKADALTVASRGQQAKQIVERFIRVSQLGQQQRSDYWVVYGAATALHLATRSPHGVGHSTFAAALELFKQAAEPALRRCKRLLPERWTVVLEQQVATVKALLPGAHKQVRLLEQAGRSGNNSPAAGAAVLASVAAQEAVATEQAASTAEDRWQGRLICDGCGERALGLRRCARCKQTQYCSRECQVAHWQVHKRDCHPA